MMKTYPGSSPCDTDAPIGTSAGSRRRPSVRAPEPMKHRSMSWLGNGPRATQQASTTPHRAPASMAR